MWIDGLGEVGSLKPVSPTKPKLCTKRQREFLDLDIRMSLGMGYKEFNQEISKMVGREITNMGLQLTMAEASMVIRKFTGKE